MLNFSIRKWRQLGLVLVMGWASSHNLAYATASAQCFGGNAERVYGANPVVTYLIMTLAPEKLAGWNFPPPKQARGIFPEGSFDKPVIGGWFGQGRTPNLEVLIKTQPDLMILSGATVAIEQQRVLEKLGMPVCHLTLDRLTDYPLAFQRLGQWLGVPERGQRLAEDFQSRLAQLQQAKNTLSDGADLKTVYYAESNSGLATECRGSIHAEVLPWAGAINPHQCPNDAAKERRYGRVDISFETLLKHNPDAVVTQEIGFYEQVYQSPRWRLLPAVKNENVLFMPQVPFRWMDRPPSFMRVLAAQWLMAQLYPEQVDWQMFEQTKAFMKLYFEYDASDLQLKQILNGAIVDERR